jgi:hypothetical protein
VQRKLAKFALRRRTQIAVEHGMATDEYLESWPDAKKRMTSGVQAMDAAYARRKSLLKGKKEDEEKE